MSSKPGRVDCFIRGAWSNVLHISAENGEYSDWKDLGAWITGDIECVSRKQGSIDILTTNALNDYTIRQYNNGKWSEWRDGGNTLMEPPSCIARTASDVDCVVQHANTKTFHFSANDGIVALKLQEDLGRTIRKRPTYGSFDRNSTTFFAVSSNNNQLMGRTRTIIGQSPSGGLVRSRTVDKGKTECHIMAWRTTGPLCVRHAKRDCAQVVQWRRLECMVQSGRRF